MPVIRPKFDLICFEALPTQFLQNAISVVWNKQLKYSECLLPLLPNLPAFGLLYQDVKIKIFRAINLSVIFMGVKTGLPQQRNKNI
jgi:hypothetical protein